MADMFPRELLPDESRATASAKRSTLSVTASATPGRRITRSAGSRATRQAGQSTARSTSSSAIPSRASSAWRSRAGRSRAAADRGMASAMASARGSRTRSHRHSITATRSSDTSTPRSRRRQALADRAGDRATGRDSASAFARARCSARADHRSHRSARLEAALERVVAFHRGVRERRQAPGFDGAATLRSCWSLGVAARADGRGCARGGGGARSPNCRAGPVARSNGPDASAGRHGLRRLRQDYARVEHARRLAREGTKVLFVCFNRGLAEHLRPASRAVV